MMKPTRLAALYLGLVFAAGAIFGFVGHSLYSQRTARAERREFSPRDYRERYVAKLEKELSLTADQASRIRTILDDTGERFRDLRRRMDPEFEAIREQQKERIMALLTAEQQPRYLQILEESRKMRERSGDGRKPK